MPTEQASLPAAVEHKSVGMTLVGTPEDQPGILEAVVAVFNNTDHGGDRILPGFFAKSIARKLPKGVWGHDWVTPIAKTLEARELNPGDPMLPPSLAALGGLYIKGQFNLDTQRGREAYSDIKFGTIDEFSIGYRTIKSKYDEETEIRDLIEGDIFEWSPVLAGMNDQTRLISIKSTKSTKSVAKADPVPGKAFADRSAEVVQAVGEFVERVEGRAQARFKAGRVLSQANFDSIVSVADAMDASCARLRGILDSAVPKRTDEPATDAAGAKADASPGEAKPAEMPAPAPQAAIEPATPAVALPAPVEPAIPPASVPAPGPDDADILAQYALTRQAVTTALVGSLIPHA